MKKKVLALLLTSSFVLAPVSVFAEAEEAAEKQMIQIEAEGAVVEVTNETSEEVKEAALTVEKAEEEKEEAAEEEKTEEAEAKEITCLVLTEEDGDVHTFKDVTVTDWKDAKLYNEYEVLYISYTDAAGKAQEVAEDLEEVVFEAPLTMYSLAKANIRKEATTEAEALKVTAVCDEWTVVGVVPGWFHIKQDDMEGYVHHFYLSEDKAKAEAILKAQQEAEAAAAAAAKAAQEAAWAEQQQQQQQQSQPAPQERYEVSRQAYDDCDGSGHGYYEITYSDGSVEYEEY